MWGAVNPDRAVPGGAQGQVSLRRVRGLPIQSDRNKTGERLAAAPRRVAPAERPLCGQQSRSGGIHLREEPWGLFQSQPFWVSSSGTSSALGLDQHHHPIPPPVSPAVTSPIHGSEGGPDAG